jgi:phage baseplate assembly protein W
MDTTGPAFPFTIDNLGRVATQAGDSNLRARVIQVLLTSPGERVNQPEFGCGLRELVFDPNNDILAAATEFAISRSLVRWLGDEILVEDVDITHEDNRLAVEVVYVRRDRLETGRVKIAF